MQKVIQQILDHFAACVNLKIQLETKQKELVMTADQQKVIAEKLQGLEIQLKAREKKLIEIEDLIQYHKDATSKLNNATELINQYTARSQAIAQFEGRVKTELREQKEVLDKREEAINKREANLEALVLEKVKSVLKR